MRSFETRIFPNLESLSQAAAYEFSRAAAAAIAVRGQFLVALSGGSTPEPLFQKLAAAPFADEIEWERVHLFWGDERCVPSDDPGSSFGQVQRILLSHVHLPGSHIHRIKGELTPAAAAADYARQLATAADPGLTWPRFDLILLGLGRDGHTASLFPGPIDPATNSRPVVPVTANYEDRPAQRVTLTPPVINSARQVLFLVSGAGKAAAVKAVLQGDTDPAAWPAQRVRPESGNLLWFLDQPAAASL